MQHLSKLLIKESFFKEHLSITFSTGLQITHYSIYQKSLSNNCDLYEGRVCIILSSACTAHSTLLSILEKFHYVFICAYSSKGVAFVFTPNASSKKI